MPNHKHTADDLLQDAKLRHTEPRAAILNVLLEASAPLTQEQIAVNIGSSAPNKTTIYRTLMSLVEKNLVHRAYMDERSWYFELAHHCSRTQCHPHFTCTQCQKTHCLTDVAVPLVELPKGYHMQRQQTLIEGICSACGNK